MKKLIASAVTRDPFLVERRHEYRARDLASPFATITASGTERALAIPVEGREGKQAQPMTAPMRTQTTRLETAVVTPRVRRVAVPAGRERRWSRPSPDRAG